MYCIEFVFLFVSLSISLSLSLCMFMCTYKIICGRVQTVRLWWHRFNSWLFQLPSVWCWCICPSQLLWALDFSLTKKGTDACLLVSYIVQVLSVQSILFFTNVHLYNQHPDQDMERYQHLTKFACVLFHDSCKINWFVCETRLKYGA